MVSVQISLIVFIGVDAPYNDITTTTPAEKVCLLTRPLEIFILILMGRDRENSTVFVADLPVGSTQDELRALFSDVRIAF